MSTNLPGRVNPIEWMSQAEAAVLREVSRQAIANLIRRGRIRVLEIGGRRLVNRQEVLSFHPKSPGRPRVNPRS